MGTRERGQVTPILAVLMVVMAVVAIGVARVGLAAADRARARTAADAAALAAVADGPAAADELAHANGGRVVQLDHIGSDVVVTVEVGGARATARARRTHAPPTQREPAVDRSPP